MRDAVDLRQPRGQRAGVGVVLGQPLDVVVERVQRARGHDPRLAQRAAEHLLVAPRLVDQLRRAGQAGAQRRAQALGEVDPRGVEAGGILGGGHARGDDGVHQPRAVHVQPQPVRRARRRRTARSCASGHTRPPAMFVVCSTRDQPRARRVAVPGVRSAPPRRRRVNIPPGAVERCIIAPANAAGPPASAMIGCDGAVQDRLVAARPDVQPERDLVAHRARGQEDAPPPCPAAPRPARAAR